MSKTMDIQPKFNVMIIIIIGVLSVAVVVVLLVITKEPSQEKPEKTTQSGFSFLLNQIPTNFYSTDNSTVADITPPPKIEEENNNINTNIVTVTIKKETTLKQIEFNKLFNHNSKPVYVNNNDSIVAYLLAANQTGEIKTYIKFNKDKNVNKDKPNKSPIKPNYNSLSIANTKASYPVDFLRTFTADRRIPAILIEDIDSTLGGKVTAQVENNVYAAQGTNILIPVGSKAVGYYRPLKKIGENRLQIIWTRIITPLGVNIIINAKLADAMGRSGLAGTIDTKFFDRYGLAILISTINAAAQANVNVENQKQAVFVNTYGKELSNLSAQILEEQINIKPIIRIPAGSRILISPTQDIWFRNSDGEIIVEPLLNR